MKKHVVLGLIGGLLLAIVSTDLVAGVITYDMTYSGDRAGTGVFVYDDTPNANRIVDWNWTFGEGQDGSMNVSLLNTFSQPLLADIRAVVTGLVVGESYSFNREEVIGYPGTITIPTPINLRLFVVFTLGTLLDHTGFWNWDVEGTVARGNYSMVARVPEPDTLPLLVVDLFGLGVVRGWRTLRGQEAASA